jgi:hypothetical protein
MVTRGQWGSEFLKAIGAPKTLHTRRAMQSWIQAEGSMARYNPLDCVLVMPGSSPFNWNNGFPVQNYVSLEQGLEATRKTLLRPGHGYPPIVKGLRENAPATEILAALANSAWGTGALAELCLPGVRTHLRAYELRTIGQ